MTSGPIRVWLEPGYDFGRTGAWMLDLPGCFVWADGRPEALAAVPLAVGRFTTWLAEHGERIADPGDGLEVVEEVASIPAGDAELNATFDADVRPIDATELERSMRWLGFAREDLLAYLDGLAPMVEQVGVGVAQRTAARDADRPALAVIRHIAVAEVWLSGRMDPAERYEGPGPHDDIRAQLAATRAWAVDRVRRSAEVANGVVLTDRRGENWTLVKVVRRLVYHSLDHLGELTASAGAERL